MATIKTETHTRVWSTIFAGILTLVVARILGSSKVLAESFAANRLDSGIYLPPNITQLTAHAVSDALIFLSCLAISSTTFVFLLRLRREIIFTWFIVTFAVFVLACGLTHATDILVLWVPLHWAALSVTVISVTASVITAVSLPFLVPKIREVLKLLEASRKNEVQLLGAAESSLDSLYLACAVHGADGEIEDFAITYVNSNAIKSTNYAVENLIGGRMCELFPAHKKLGLFDKYKQVVLTGVPFVGEFAMDEDTIHSAWLQVQAVKLGDGVALTSSDITARKTQEETLRRNEGMLCRAERLCTLGSWELDLETREMSWSREIHRILAVDPAYKPTLEETIQFFVPKDQLVIGAAIDRALSDGTGWDLEVNAISVDGRHVPVRLIGRTESIGGKPVRLAGALKDITSQVEERLKLSTANDRLSIATETVRLGIWEWNIATGTIAWDSQMFQLYGMETSDDSVTYTTWREAVHPADVVAAERAVLEAVEGIQLFETTFRIVWPDGTEHDIEATGRVTHDVNGRATRMIGTNLDISERLHLAAEAHRVSELEMLLKDQFLSHVSHELRSPLAAIDAFSSLMADGLAGEVNPQQDEYLRIILRNAAQLLSMIEDLLQVTQAKEGKVHIALACVSAPEIISDVLSTFQRAARDQKINFTANYPPDLALVHTDAVRLRQILIILCDNAIKFTPAGGEVTIYAKASAEHADFLRLGVCDTGRGIEPDKVERIFEHLYQVVDPSDTGRDGRKGLGLGLHIARELVERLNGRLRVDTQLGVGSDFHFTVPIFSLKSLIISVLGRDNNLGEAFALLTVEFRAHERSSPVPDDIFSLARTLAQECLRPDTDVMIPSIDSISGHRLFIVLAHGPEQAAQIIGTRILSKFSRHAELQSVDFTYNVSHSVLDYISRGIDESLESYLEHLVTEIQDYVNRTCLQRRLQSESKENSSCR